MCDTSGATDYFPDKVQPDYSVSWNITYHGWYKILSNSAADESYVVLPFAIPLLPTQLQYRFGSASLLHALAFLQPSR